MSRLYNFGAGPGMLPTEVLLTAQKELLNWHGIGMSIMEVGHRTADFQQVADDASRDLRELMSIPDNYHIVFLAGGASVHFAMVPLNLLGPATSADYVDTGVWSKKAIAEGQRYAKMNVAAVTQSNDGLLSIPAQSEWKLNPEAAYLHYTPNETIEGIEFDWIPETEAPLVADMSSNILSKTIDVSRFGLIYAGAQKNMGPAGISVAIIREDLLQEPKPHTPSLYSYKLQADNGSFYNTPPTYNWYLLGLVLAWMKKEGGVPAFAALNARKAKKLYAIIDDNAGFYQSRVHPSCRSKMNVTFDLPTPALTQLFLEKAKTQGLVNLKGHRLAGGVRASIYNAMPEAGVDILADFMQEFVKKQG